MEQHIKLALQLVSDQLVEGHQPNDEETILNVLHGRVAYLLDHNPDLLMSYMYRLDVEESKIKEVFKEKSDLSVAGQLARLIWDRQKLRAKTKLMYRSKSEGL